MKKKFIIGLLSIIILFTTTACENKPNNETITPNDNNPGTAVDGQKGDLQEGLYSDGTKYVFEQGNTKYVFYYSGETITGYKTFTEYEDEETAKGAYEFLKGQNLTGVDKFYTQGKYLVYELNESEYSNLTTSDIKTAYSYMTEVTR